MTLDIKQADKKYYSTSLNYNGIVDLIDLLMILFFVNFSLEFSATEFCISLCVKLIKRLVKPIKNSMRISK